MDVHTRAVSGDKAVHDSSMERWMEVTLMRGRRKVCQSGISKGQKEWRTGGGFCYSDRRLTAERGVVRCQLRRWRVGKRSSCDRATGRSPRGWWRKDGEGKAIQAVETTE